jgi:signal transduction histidine kinase
VTPQHTKRKIPHLGYQVVDLPLTIGKEIMAYSVSNNQATKIETQHQSIVLETPSEQAFDDLVSLATQICGTPMALINLMDLKRQWFKAIVGLDVEKLLREMRFCRICVEQMDVLIVPDTLADERFATTVEVTCEPHIRFYTGVPLITLEGKAIGTLCVMDSIPRKISSQQVEGLQSLSRLVVKQLEIEGSLDELARLKKDYHQIEESLHQLEKQFLRAQRLECIGTLTSGIAHDLNNILSPILMSVQILKSKCHDERSKQMLTILEKNAQRGANLVKQVLSFVRGIEANHTIIFAKHLILETKQILEQTFPKSVTVNTEIETDLCSVCGDSTQLHQVLMNLCLNARDAMPQGGNLTISAKNLYLDENYVKIHPSAEVGSYIVVSVVDTGVGIPNDLLDRIFEPFFTTKEFGQGTGLGLSTVMGIVKKHNGFITVSSVVGKGTQFQVYLPAAKTTATQLVQNMEVLKKQGEIQQSVGVQEVETKHCASIAVNRQPPVKTLHGKSLLTIN